MKAEIIMLIAQAYSLSEAKVTNLPWTVLEREEMDLFVSQGD